jgi:hypothetical protein
VLLSGVDDEKRGGGEDESRGETYAANGSFYG